VISVVRLRNPIAQSLLILLEESGLDYKDHFPETDQEFFEYTGIADAGRLPPLLLDDQPIGGGEPTAIIHTGAAMVYLAAKARAASSERAREFIPEDQNENLAAHQWVMWQAVCHNFRPTGGEAGELNYHANSLFNLVNTWLSGRNFIAGGHYSIADMMCYPWVANWLAGQNEAYGRENLNAWLSRVWSRGAVRSGMTKSENTPADGPLRAGEALARALRYTYAAGDPTTPWGRPP
jgi:GSH-dependent disulfide-bond oxidoreductase